MIGRQNETSQIETVNIEFTAKGKNTVKIPAGNWLLSVSAGNAWVFCQGGDFIVHSGENIEIDATDMAATVRNLNPSDEISYSIRPVKL